MSVSSLLHNRSKLQLPFVFIVFPFVLTVITLRVNCEVICPSNAQYVAPAHFEPQP